MKKVFIALRMAGVSGTEKMAGIYRYLAGRHSWSVTLVRTLNDMTPEAVRAAIDQRADGFILSLPGAVEAAGLIASTSIPTVVMDMHEPALAARTRNIAFIRNDPKAIGRAAAGFLLSQGVYRSYAVVHDRNMMPWSHARASAFRQRLAEVGLPVTEFDGSIADEDLVQSFSRLAAPVGVFVTHDDRAQGVLEACRRMPSLNVPKTVAVLGVDNDTLLCEHTSPPLSSIQPDFEEEGFRAAMQLDMMMSGKCRSPSSPILCGVKTIACRQSTAPSSPAGLLVQKAVAFIEKHACLGIEVPDVVKHLGVSRALADRRFRELQKTSITAAIVDRQLAEIRRRLVSTNEPIEQITTDCGWTSPNYPKRLFKRRYQMTMREFRRLYGR